MPIFALTDEPVFPHPELARDDGLLAVGGDLSVDRLLAAYRMGIFPWYSDGTPILWWSPNPRLVLFPEEMNISRRLQRKIRQGRFKITFDTAFQRVVHSCAQVHRRKEGSTWITREMAAAYCRLHRAGFAHSVETWCENHLAGGIYGVFLGGCFFGESMFTKVSDASKAALAGLVGYLIHAGCKVIDCQVTTAHMVRMGAREIPRRVFLAYLAESESSKTQQGKWVHAALPEAGWRRIQDS